MNRVESESEKNLKDKSSPQRLKQEYYKPSIKNCEIKGQI